MDECTCTPRYMSGCNQCEGEGCWACEEGWVMVEPSEYEVDKNTERSFLVIHEDSCQLVESASRARQNPKGRNREKW